MSLPDAHRLYAVVEGTWPPADRQRLGPWTIRQGQGGGSRVSAATAEAPVTEADIAQAEEAMLALGQPRLFMIRQGDDALDHMLATAGYEVKDPVTLYAVPTETLAAERPPHAMTFRAWPPLSVQREIWAEGGIGPARLSVMERAKGPKTAILGRIVHTPAGVAFVAIHDGIAMIHALEVLPTHRRRGVAQRILRAVAHWAEDEGAAHVALVVTRANEGANALYSALGFSVVGHYHYRIRP